MLKVHSEPPKPKLDYQGAALFALGFRPFFTLAGTGGIALLLLWLGIWSGGIPASGYYDPITWHSHEMLFGYAAAVISGFLLTSVRNWTGINTPQGRPLIYLGLLWLAGRLAPLLAGTIPHAVIAVLDLAFLPAVALAIQPALWQGRQKINRIFVPILLIMGVANLLVHLQALGLTSTAGKGIDMMLYMVIFLIVIIAGRVMPFFTQAVLPGYQAYRWAWVEASVSVGLGLFILLQLFFPDPMLSAMLAFVVALSQAVRLGGWYDHRIWQLPILWVLYSGYLWLTAGFMLIVIASLGVIPANVAKHALTIGGIGVLTLGMMARVSLGHTGRPIAPPRIITLAFIILNLAAAVRVFGPIFAAGSYNLWIHLSGGLWIIAFLIFCAVYLPMLGRPRVDGKPG